MERIPADATRSLSFRLDVTRPERRELLVSVVAPVADASRSLVFRLASWTPGSYLLREYARHLSRVEACDEHGEPLPCSKVAKNRYAVEPGDSSSVELRYRVYAHELSVRTAHVDATHAYWNHACVLLWPEDMRTEPVEILVDHPEHWILTCSLPATSANADGEAAGRDGIRTTCLRADDVDAAIDAPVLLGRTERIEFEALGVPHSCVLDGMAPVRPPATLASDLERIVHAAAAVFGDSLPYEHYTFLSLFTDEGYGGLEHRESSTLLTRRTALSTPSGYREFLALAAHELFHAWNVKRMRPVEFWEYDYEHENYTKLLWLMEGWTAYYDDLLVRRARLSTHRDYLQAMAKNIQGMRNAPGRFELSLEESSYDAWIRLYRPDENTRNSSQNYYGNGAVAALCLDLMIRDRTDGNRSLDDVIAMLFRTTYENGRGYATADVHQVLDELVGPEVKEHLTAWVAGPLDPDLTSPLQQVGLELQLEGTDDPYLGVAFRAGTTTIASVTKGSAADACGLAPDDEVLAIAGLRVTSRNWQTVFQAVARPGDVLPLLLSRRGVITELSATAQPHPGTVRLVERASASPEQIAARIAWLGADGIAGRDQTE